MTMEASGTGIGILERVLIVASLIMNSTTQLSGRLGRGIRDFRTLLSFEHISRMWLTSKYHLAYIEG